MGVVADAAAYLWTTVIVAMRRAPGAVAVEQAAAPVPPRWILGGARGFAAARRRHASNCLMDAHLRQGWHAAGGDRRLLHLGVRATHEGFAFHAWLDGDDDDGAGFAALMSRGVDGRSQPTVKGRAQTPSPSPRVGARDRRSAAMTSVILPARDARSSIVTQIEALSRQTYSGSWELVVVDDASSDGTAAEARRAADRLDLPLRLLGKRRRLGCAGAKNAGARAAAGDLLAFCDADDVVSPDWLSQLVSAAGEADQVGGFCDAHTLNPMDRGRRGLPPDRLPDAAGIPYAVGANMAVWADAFAAVGGFREDYRINSDIEFSARLRRHGLRLGFAPRAVVYYRHRSSCRAVARRQLRGGMGAARLYRDLREDGIERSLGAAALAWLWLVVHLPALVIGPPERRVRWVGRLAYRVGRLIGSVRFRIAYP